MTPRRIGSPSKVQLFSRCSAFRAVSAGNALAIGDDLSDADGVRSHSLESAPRASTTCASCAAASRPSRVHQALDWSAYRIDRRDHAFGGFDHFARIEADVLANCPSS